MPSAEQPDRILLKEQVHRFSHYITGDVLDIGGGDISRYKNYFKNKKKYVCLEVTEGPEVDIVGSADNIPCPDASFDSVISTQVWEHVKYPEKCTQEANRVLKKGGYALITIPQWNELHSEPYDFWRYTNYGLKELFERNGFETIEFEQRGGYYLTLAQIRMRFWIDKYRLGKKPRIVNKILGRIFALYREFARWRDNRDTSVANRKHAIGWCFVFRKL